MTSRGLAIFALMSALASSSIASAQTKTSTSAAAAAQHAEIGRELYKKGNYVEALEEFRRAYAIDQSSSLLYNIARCYERLSQWQEALTMYEKYAKVATDARDRADALDKIEMLKAKVGPDSKSPDAMYQARIDAGRRAYSKSDYESAIAEFKAAFDIKPTGGALYNVAKSYERLARYEEAIDYFTQYIELDPHVSDRADVEETIRRLKKSLKERFQELAVSSDPPGADIYLDDRNSGLQGQTNFRFKVTPGPHTMYLDINGYEPVKRDFVMPDDKPLALDFKMKKLENVGFIEFKVSKDGARIFVDGAIVGLSPYKEKKALAAGAHQIQVELPGFQRWTQTAMVNRDQTTTANVDLEKFDASIADDTLSKWGRNLMLIGIIGGGLGFTSPFLYQKVVLRRDPFGQLGPAVLSEENVYRGPVDEKAANFRKDPTHGTLRNIQTWSLIGGSVLMAGGLSFYMYKWFREPPPQPVTASNDQSTDVPWTFVFSPSNEGAAFEIAGSF